MPSIDAVSIAPPAREWLADSRQARVLHVFDRACNLINERGEVLSIVTQQIGNGPFNLVIQDDILFSDHLNVQSPISIRENQLNLGTLTINTDTASLWCSRPDWEMLHAGKEGIINQLPNLREWIRECAHPNGSPISNSPISNSLISSITTIDLQSSGNSARGLAGLGQGLTPAGDDFILGAVFAAWIIHPSDVARIIAEATTNAAAPLTTSLSAAWLRAAGRGEAGILWHLFFGVLTSGDRMAIQECTERLLAVGHTSGADALSGFVHVVNCYSVIRGKSCLS